MNTRIILVALGVTALASSCSTAYRTGQTPDDVYYSPARETSGYVQTQPRSERPSSADYYEHPDDRYLRMMVRNRSRWSAFDDYAMMDWRFNPYMNPYSYSSFNNPWGFSYFNSYWNWNNFYNPYYPGVVIINPKSTPREYRKVRDFNLNTYTNRNYYNNGRAVSAKAVTRGTYNRYYNSSSNNNPTTSQSSGSSFRKVFSGSSNNGSGRDRYYSPGSQSSGNDRPSRTYTPPPSSSNSSPAPARSSSNSGGGGGGVSRPGRN